MGVIFKSIFKNIFEKKFRTCLIIFTIIVTTSLFFASNAINKSIMKMYLEKMRQNYGTTDILIKPGEDAKSPFISTDEVEKYKDRMDYVIGFLEVPALCKDADNNSTSIILNGINYKDLKTYNKVDLKEVSGIESFEGNKIIISENTSKKLGVKTGDSIELNINGEKHDFKVVGISMPTGLFLSDAQAVFMVVPKDTLGSILKTSGNVNRIYLKLKNSSEKQQMIEKISKDYTQCDVKEPFTSDDIKTQTQGLSIQINMIVFILFILSLFIIYSCFSIIALERIPFIGTFRSIGATRKRTSYILLLEGLLYGLIGGIFGCILGIGILYLMSYSVSQIYTKGASVAMDFSTIDILIAFLMAIILSFVSSFIPILRVSKIPIKDLIIGTTESKVKRKTWKVFLGITLLILSIMMPPFAPKGMSMIIDIICIIGSIIALIILVPFMTNILATILERFITYVFGNEGTLAVKNLKNNKTISNNVILMTIGIACMVTMNMVSNSVYDDLKNFFTNNARFDVSVAAKQIDNDFIEKLRKVEGVKDVSGILNVKNIKMAGKKDSIGVIQGISSIKYLDYWNIDFEGDGKTLIGKLSEGRNILIAYVLREKYGFKIGDKITLKMKQGDMDYTVVGFFNSINYNGSFALASEDNLIKDIGKSYFSQVIIKTSEDPVEVSKNIKNQFYSKDPQIKVMSQYNKEVVDDNARITFTLKLFVYLSMLLGVIGIVNNYIISFIQRKHSLAVLRLLGMSKAQMTKMMFVESLTGMIAGIFGISEGVLMVWIVSFIVKAINSPYNIHFYFGILIEALIASIIFTVVASVAPVIKSRKLNIIEAIRYE